MRKSVQTAVMTLSLAALVLVPGCSRQPQQKPPKVDTAAPKPQARPPAESRVAISDEEKLTPQTNDTLEVVSTEPESPAVLTVRDDFLVRVSYHLESVDEALILIDESTAEDATVPVWTSGSYPHPRGDGIKEGRINYKAPQHLTEIRVVMRDAVTYGTLCEITHPVDVRWRAREWPTADRIEVLATDPPSGSTLSSGDKFFVKVAWKIDSVDQAVVLISATLTSKPAEESTSIMQSFSRGEGTTVGWISFTTDVHVVEIRAMLRDKATGRVLHEVFHEVDVTWE